MFSMSSTILLSFLGASFAMAQADATVVKPVAIAATDAGKPAIGHAPAPDPFLGLAYLELAYGVKTIDAMVEGPEPGFLGIVLLSDSPVTVNYFVSLPPMLLNPVVMGIGRADGQVLHLSVPRRPEVAPELYGQAVILVPQGFLVGGVVVLTSDIGK